MGIFKKTKEMGDAVVEALAFPAEVLFNELAEITDHPIAKTKQYTAGIRFGARNNLITQAMNQTMGFKKGEIGEYKLFNVFYPDIRGNDPKGIKVVALPWTIERENSLLANLYLDVLQGTWNKYGYGLVDTQSIFTTPENLADRVLLETKGQHEVVVAESLQALLDKLDEQALSFRTQNVWETTPYDLPSAKAMRGIYYELMEKRQNELERTIAEIEKHEQSKDSLEILATVARDPQLVSKIVSKIKIDEKELGQLYQDSLKAKQKLDEFMESPKYLKGKEKFGIMKTMHERSVEANAQGLENAQQHYDKFRQDRREIINRKWEIKDKKAEAEALQQKHQAEIAELEEKHRLEMMELQRKQSQEIIPVTQKRMSLEAEQAAHKKAHKKEFRGHYDEYLLD